MVAKISVTIDEEYKTVIDEPLEYGDYRSHRANDLLGLGLAVEDELLKGGVLHAFGPDQGDSWVGGDVDQGAMEEFVREAVRQEVECRGEQNLSGESPPERE